MSAAEGQSVAELTVKTLKSMCTDANFSAFFTLCSCFHERSNVNLPVLPQKEKYQGDMKMELRMAHTVLLLKIITVKHTMRY